MSAQPLSEREILRRAMAEKPDGFWPRGVGHVVLAVPGSRLENKGYHEPGGSFSPSPGSFGIAIAVMNGGAIERTSDTIPLEKITQRWEWTAASLPSLVTETADYRAAWSVISETEFRLKIEKRGAAALALRIRPEGPAGGPVTSMKPAGGVLRINERWTVAAPGVGAELWKLEGAGPWVVVVKDSRPAEASPLAPVAARPRVLLPDARFAASLDAQIAHLRMGLTGAETRPGETVNYPLAWLRDGTYTLTALARAGQLVTARRLSRLFAERDFFGGFGPEADAPGLAAWALEETAVRVNDPAFDRELWPHVFRKAEIILAMLRAEKPIRAVAYGPIVPRHLKDPSLTLVCEPTRDGLIVGRMDWHRPLLFINAVSYRGLLSAAALARRMGAREDAARWERAAGGLREAWWRAFDTKERDNERTAIVGLWPTGVASDDAARYRPVLEALWAKTRTADGGFKARPLWTYFEIAQAHEWLLAGEPARAWKTLEWFWNNQASPGLYTWWEGEGEENSFGLWESIRGWVNPPHVTPHYWTAAEMLALQLDMLAYVDDDGALVVGAGIPKEWAASPMRVSGIHTRRGVAAWMWDGKRLTATLNGRAVRAKPGPAFQASAAKGLRFRA